jgi:ABC-type glycerol-3-phosphate transport system substrate-binding protein
MIRQIQPHSAVATSGAVSQLFSTGDVWAALWGAHVGQRIAASDIDVSVAHPEINGKPVAIARGFLGVVADSPNKEAAEFYINAILSNKVQERFSTQYGMVPVTSDALDTARAKAETDKAGTPFLKLDAKDVANAWWPDYEVIDKREWAREFQRALAK